MHLLRNRVVALVLLVLFAWTSEASAVFCPVLPLHVTLWVGDTAIHPMCNYDTIQQAVDAVQCPNTVIVLTHEHTYTSQHITINNKPSMTLAGVDVPIACGTAPPVVNSYVRTIDGSGNGNRSVFSITNSDVTFQYLEIIGGHTAINARGGGISAAGSSDITLQASTIDENSADFGGGIAVVDTGTLTIKERVIILNNVARGNGGGVFLAGSAHMDMRGELSTIAFNQATGHDGDFGFGGGVFVTGNAIADIASPPNLTGTIGSNNARAGGGVAALGTSNGTAAVRLFSIDPQRPVLVFGNSASVHGGGLYAAGGGGSIGWVCAQDFRVDGNNAPDGAAMYSADAIFLNSHAGAGPCSDDAFAADIGGSVCVAGQAVPCNEVSGNEAVTAAGDPSGGAIIAGSDFLGLNRMTLRDNDGGEMIHSDDYVRMSNSLIVDNRSVHEIVHADGPYIGNTTIANNSIVNGYVIFAHDGFYFEDNIIWQPGHQTIDYVADGCGDCFSATNTLTNDATGFEFSQSVLAVQDMGFVDSDNPNPKRRDYHLGAWTLNGKDLFSQAIDFAAPLPYVDNTDLDNHAYDQDVTIVRDFLGTHDLGCYELQANRIISDRVFADAFGERTTLLR